MHYEFNLCSRETHIIGLYEQELLPSRIKAMREVFGVLNGWLQLAYRVSHARDSQTRAKNS